MSDHIPFEIQSEIIKRVHPVESLIRFRCVCKQWKSLIDSPEFITHHLLVNTQPHHLLIRYKEEDASDIKFVSIVDDDNNNNNNNNGTTFPQHKFYLTRPPTVTNKSMLDSSHGLVCFDRELPSKLIVVWNPSIRKSIGIVSPIGTYYVGFGVCPNTSDIKIVAIKADLTAEVFTLSTRIWRRIPMNLLELVIFAYDQVVVDAVVHWVACDLNEEVYRKRIITFDFASEEFGEVALPDGLVGSNNVVMSRFKESLAVIDYREDNAGKIVCDVWVMFKNGVTKSSLFTKLFTVHHNSFDFSVIGFRKNGQPIVELNDGSKEKELQVYEPDSKHVNGLGIYGSCFDMVNYTESLLLLNHSDSIIQ